MGTRSMIRVFEDNQPVILMYGQYDGYPSGLGLNIATFLNGMVVGNGIPWNVPPKFANGMGCLAAQLVGYLKNGPGEFYLCPMDTVDAGQEYEYNIYNDRVMIQKYDSSSPLFDGTWDQFYSFCMHSKD